MMKRFAIFAACGAVLGLLAGCGSSIDPAVAESAFVNTAGMPISSMCNSSDPGWSCYYDGTDTAGSALVVKLTTDAGADGDALATRAGTAWFNFIHCQFPDLDTIVVRINGVDHNVARSSTAADRMPC